ncbi:helix-turn-helix domain-containing protein [Type-D symbiont of Plautia stali]|uniref:helix-turn-helix domain-containing protein n=1 Tax=Type-D symbiont of Plautia stali TaxID=1560356 RepID=UPI00073F4767|nr:AraC family transcriptional regulator [Type-D symbiont of Plautia stali]
MPSIPLPLVTLLVLLILMLTLWIGDRQRHRHTLRFLLLCSLLLTVGIVRWVWPSPMLMLLRVLIATVLPALAWHCFSHLTQHSVSRWHIAPVILAIIIQQCWPPAIDAVLFALYLAYGMALIHVGIRGSEKLTEVRISEVPFAAKMALAAGIFLCFSGVTDLLVAVEFAWHQGKFALPLIALLQTFMLPFLALAIALAARTRPIAPEASVPEVEVVDIPSPEQAALCEQLEERLRKNALFLENNLTLNMLARKAGIPARQISRAVNTTYHCNVSQWVNGLRISHAQHLLRNSALPITEVMLASGFTTKSNFNREFLRISGMTPSAFRQLGNSAPERERV